MKPERYSHDRYNRLVADTFDELQKLATLKGGEYSGDEDRLANFRRNAEALGVNKETVWAVYAAKHWDALMQFIRDEQQGKERQRLESLSGRVDDLIVYCLLFKAMLDERGMVHSSGEQTTPTSPIEFYVYNGTRRETIPYPIDWTGPGLYRVDPASGVAHLREAQL